MATYNGTSHIEAQLKSIFENIGFDIHVFISDDGSTDQTLEIIRSFGDRRITILDGPRLGSAGQNFFSLLKLSVWDDFDFVSLADQDDIWDPNKLQVAIDAINATGAVAVSSDVTAFWENGRTRYIKKSYKQTPFDHFFESAGPGCTYVFTISAARFIRATIREKFDIVRQIQAHDWLFYAIIRNAGYQWKILNTSTMLYRQHGKNVAGVNSGPKAIFRRLIAATIGWYKEDMNNIFRLTEPPSLLTAAIRPKGLLPVLRLLISASDLRRRPIEKFMIAPLLLIVYVSQLVSVLFKR